MTNLVIDFKFGQGLNRRSKWQDLNEIFQDAVKQGYQSQERATLTGPEVTKGITVVRRIKEEQASNSGRLEHRCADKIPDDNLSADDDEISICEKYANTWDFGVSASGEAVIQEECLNNVNALRNLETLNISDGRPPHQLTPGERSSRQDIVQEESSGIGAVRYASPLNSFRVHNTIHGQYATRPKLVDPLHIQPPRQLPPSDQQGNGQTKRRETLYEYSWTGM